MVVDISDKTPTQRTAAKRAVAERRFSLLLGEISALSDHSAKLRLLDALVEYVKAETDAELSQIGEIRPLLGFTE